jgi:hypothetical protein
MTQGLKVQFLANGDDRNESRRTAHGSDKDNTRYGGEAVKWYVFKFENMPPVHFLESMI